jgi:hypothetical protein
VEPREAVEAADRADDTAALVAALELQAAALASDGDYDRAACILAGAEVLGPVGPASDRTRAIVEEAIGTVRLTELTSEGRHLSRVDLVALALRQG